MVKKLDTLGAILKKSTPPIDSSLQPQQAQSVVKPDTPQQQTQRTQAATQAQQQNTQQPLQTQTPPTPQQSGQVDHTYIPPIDTPDDTISAEDIRRYTGYNIEKTPQQQEAERRRRLNYDEMYKVMDDEIKRSEPETEEEKKKREKKEKRQLLWASIGDGVSALANLYFTGKDAPNMYDKNGGMVKRHNELVEKMRKEREADRDRHLDYVMRRAQLADRDFDRDFDRDLAEQRSQQSAYLAARRAKQEEEEHGWKGQFMGAKIDAMQADAKNKEAIANAQADIKKAEKELIEAKTEAQKAAAKANLARAVKAYEDAKSNRIKALKMRNGNEKEFFAYDKKGNKHAFSTPAAQERYAREQGTWVNDYTEEVSTKQDQYTGKPITTKKKAIKGGHAKNPKQWASGLKF